MSRCSSSCTRRIARNERVWAHSSAEVPAIDTVKQPLKVMVWAMMSHQGLSELHFVPRGQTVTAQYYVEEILKKSAASAMKRKRKTGPPTQVELQRKRKTGPLTQVELLPKMSEAIFQQDGAPAHHATSTRQWCRDNLPGFWEKGVWPGNSPDLSPIENVWAIVQNELDMMEPATTEKALIRNLQRAWLSISAETLDNLMCGMPDRMRECVRLGGGYIGK